MTTKAEITLPIYGMSCQKCVAKVSAALQAVAGVSAVVVSLEEQQGRVQVVDGGPGREELLGVVVATGFQIVAPITKDETETTESRSADNSVKIETNRTSTFLLQGMTCANCAQTIEKGVARMPGVSSATVNFAAEKLSVLYDPNLVQSTDLIVKVDALGYRAAAEDSEDLHEASRQGMVKDCQSHAGDFPGVYPSNLKVLECLHQEKSREHFSWSGFFSTGG